MEKNELKQVVIENMKSLSKTELNEIYNLLIDEINLREAEREDLK